MISCEVISDDAARTIVCAASSVGVWWLLPAIAALSALAAGVISVRAIAANKEIARKRATLDLLERSESTEYYQSIYSAFLDARKSADGFAPLMDPGSEVLRDRRRKVVNFLNHYELIAIGIRNGILDEGLCKEFMRSIVVRDWVAVQDFVLHIRAPTPDSGTEVTANLAFSEFERLAHKWAPEIHVTIPQGNKP